MLTEQNSALLKKVKHGLKDYTVLIALGLIWILFSILTNGIFLKPRNISNLFRQASIISFLATGMVLVIVLGNIDLSVGSVVGFLSAVTAFLQVKVFYDLMPRVFPAMTATGQGIMSTIFTIIVVLLLAVVIGVWQGSLIAYLKIPAFIVTLGGMQLFRGGVLGVTQGKTISPVDSSLVAIAQGYVSKPLGWIIALGVVGVIYFTTVLGRNQKKSYGFEIPVMWKDMLKASVRYAYAVGGNLEATRLSGINIKKTIFLVHVLMGVLSGVAGIILTGYVAAGTVNAGQNYELDTIASCVIGGTSLMGGKGTIIGAMVGSLIMASIVNGMSVMNMDIFWQYVVKGLVLIVAVYIDVVSNKQKS